ncbi:MAG: type II toxin-antitoxin system VapC family toxin [Pseudomonadota bacterium]|nr:type II toxin-antitoxin system VapC family toxin [Pseudomonadota bacterium]
MIVVDASVVLEVLLRTPAADELEARLFSPVTTLHAPHLLDVEVAQVLRRYCRAGDISPQRGADALTDLDDLSIARYPHTIFLPRIWELRDNVTAYDAAYIALAEILAAPLITRDGRLLKAPGHVARVELH